MYHVYILASLKDPTRIYIGRTTDLHKRLQEHNSGQSQFTKSYTPWRFETYISFSKEHLAVAFERYLKAGSGHAFLKKRLLPTISETEKLNRIK